MDTTSRVARTTPIEERAIRSALLSLLSEGRNSGSRVLEEFRIERGASRIDVAVINDALVGYEIKSDKDTFTRFSNQIHAYNRVFDRINLVCGEILAGYAAEVVPSWWGIILANRDPTGAICLSVKRVASANPKQDPFSLASLLWKDEAIAALSSAKSNAPKKASAYSLWDLISKSMTVEAIREAVADSLMRRQYYSESTVKTM